MSSPRWLYLHGFASSPRSTKALAFQAWGAKRGLEIDALELRVPSFERLRLSAIKARVREAIGGPLDRAVLIGSSLGGLTACRVAEEDPRVCAVLAMAPAFRLAETWRKTLGEDGWKRWHEVGTLTVDDHATQQKRTLDVGFVDELATLEAQPADVRVPVLIVHGTRDEVVSVERSREWARRRRHVRLVEVDDGHELRASIERVLTEADAFFAPFLADPSS